MEKIKIGRITGAQGLHGELKLYHDSGDEEALRRLTSLFLYKDDAYKAFRIEKMRMQKRTPIMKLHGVDDRDAAEALIGCEIYSDKDEARPYEEGAWLVTDLVGLEVRFAESDDMTAIENMGSLGDCRINNVIDNPAHDILEIETGKGMRLLPFVDVFVREVDTEAGFIIVIPPTGWLE